ncbi:hypothetical protein PINS_up021434 [Pythium insidiosum]|nr:hypothetical protein PINS_up007257 [Pythium insidiosum]GLE09664.1 hypothetical protein PINS_up021434 [Pythium insidiosum]
MASSSGNSNGDGAAKRSRKQSEEQMAMMARINSMNDLLAAHGITEGNILQFLAIIEQRSNELIEQFSRRLQHKNPSELSRATLGAHLKPSDPSRAVVAARAMIPESTGQSPGPPGSPPGPLPVTGAMGGLASFLNAGSAVTTSITEEDGSQPSSDDEDDDHPMTKAELQRRAAKSVAMGMQLNPKVSQTSRPRMTPQKKKKQ